MGKKSPDRFLYLYQKDPVTWLRIKNGAWGKLTFNEYCAKFVLDAYGLVPHMAYALIRAIRPWPHVHVVAGWRTLSYLRRGKFGPSMPTDPALEKTK
jgi:hypothetical protein